MTWTKKCPPAYRCQIDRNRSRFKIWVKHSALNINERLTPGLHSFNRHFHDNKTSLFPVYPRQAQIELFSYLWCDHWLGTAREDAETLARNHQQLNEHHRSGVSINIPVQHQGETKWRERVLVSFTSFSGGRLRTDVSAYLVPRHRIPRGGLTRHFAMSAHRVVCVPRLL